MPGNKKLQQLGAGGSIKKDQGNNYQLQTANHCFGLTTHRNGEYRRRFRTTVHRPERASKAPDCVFKLHKNYRGPLGALQWSFKVIGSRLAHKLCRGDNIKPQDVGGFVRVLVDIGA